MEPGRRATYVVYTRSLLWITLFIGIFAGVTVIFELVFVDFVRGNPHRTKTHALFLMAFFPPILAVVTMFGSFLVFTVPQFFQAMVSDLTSRFHRDPQLYVLFALPVTATLAWYCYDYLALHDFYLTPRGYGDADWTPYQHGLTLQRDMTMLAIQTPFSLFSLWYFNAALRRGSKKWAIFSALMLAIVAGIVWGHELAKIQYQFLPARDH